MKAILFGGEHHLERTNVPDGTPVIDRTIAKTEQPSVRANPDSPIKPTIRAVESYHIGSFFPHGNRAIFVHSPLYYLCYRGRYEHRSRAIIFKMAWYILEVPEFRDNADPELVNHVLQLYFNNNLNDWIN